MRRVITFALLAAVVLCAASAAFAEPVKLEYKFTKGEVEKYNLSLSASISGPNISTSFTMTAPIQQRTLEVYADGSAKVRAFISEPQISGTALPKGSVNKPKSVTLVKTIAKDGRVLSCTSDDGSGAGYNLMPSDLAVMPADFVAVGQKWNQTMPVPGMSAQMIIESKLASVDAQGPAQIQQTFSTHLDFSQMLRSVLGSIAASNNHRMTGKEAAGIGGGMDLSGTNTISFSVALGKLTSISTSENGTMTMMAPVGNGGTGSQSMRINVSATSTMTKTQ